MNSSEKKSSASGIAKEAFVNSLKKLNPLKLKDNPIIFCVEAAALLASAAFIESAVIKTGENPFFILQTAIWLWLTVIFANFAESVAESRGKAHADSLKKAKKGLMAKKTETQDSEVFENTAAADLKKGDFVIAQAGDIIAGDGEIVRGIASIDESAVTGESAPVIREAGGDRSAVIGGTKVLSDRIVYIITAEQGQSFLDKMISLVEGAVRKKTPNELALHIMLVFLTVVFLLVTATLKPFSVYLGGNLTVTQLAALFVALAPTTIGALLSAIGIAGMNRLLKINVLAFSGRSVEAAGDVDIVMLDKTGTITLGNRQAVAFLPVKGVSEEELALYAQYSSLADETPEGRSVVVLAKKKFNIRQHEFGSADKVHFVPFMAISKMSGIDVNGSKIRKGASDAVCEFVKQNWTQAKVPADIQEISDSVASKGGTPLAVSINERILGVIYLKDVLKGGIKEKLAELHKTGIRSVMITGDNALTAASIAAEAGVSGFLSNAKPETKLAQIRKYQAEGHMVAMIGDGTNDAPALAQADVGIAMNTGTAAAREAGNMLDLDSSPTKVIEVVEIGKQILMTRGALTTFSISNDIAKYFALLPAMFCGMFPQLGLLNVMRLGSPSSAMLSAIIFNALIIPALIPLALRGVKYKPESAQKLLLKNVFVYGLGGIITPFIGIKLIDLAVNMLHII